MWTMVDYRPTANKSKELRYCFLAVFWYPGFLHWVLSEQIFYRFNIEMIILNTECVWIQPLCAYVPCHIRFLFIGTVLICAKSYAGHLRSLFRAWGNQSQEFRFYLSSFKVISQKNVIKHSVCHCMPIKSHLKSLKNKHLTWVVT